VFCGVGKPVTVCVDVTVAVGFAIFSPLIGSAGVLDFLQPGANVKMIKVVMRVAAIFQFTNTSFFL
jgi:hypothetical protein